MAARLIFLGAFLAAGCETGVDPFQTSGNYFSVGGIIDALADTQFVRISPLRKMAPIGPADTAAVVVTVELESGRTAVWRDSLFSLRTGYVHNYWSTFDFEPGRTYRLTARTAEGHESRVVVALPDTFPDPVVQQTMFDPIPNLEIVGVERLADLRILYCGGTPSGGVRRYEAQLIRNVSRHSAGYAIRFDPFSLANALNVGPILWMRVLTVAATPDWPDFKLIDDETLAHPHTVTNVENGVGFLGGVTSKIIDWPGFEPRDPACIDLLRSW